MVVGIVCGELMLTVPGAQIRQNGLCVRGLAQQADGAGAAADGTAQGRNAKAGSAVGVHLGGNLVEGIAHQVSQLADDGVKGAGSAAAQLEEGLVPALQGRGGVQLLVGKRMRGSLNGGLCLGAVISAQQGAGNAQRGGAQGDLAGSAHKITTALEFLIFHDRFPPFT